MKRCPNKINYWETENLTGSLRIWKENCSVPAVCSYEFKMPTKNAVGRKAKEHILNAAGCVGFIDISFRCVKHSVVCSVTSRVVQTERFSFRRSDLPDIRYDIELREDMDSCEGIGFTGGFEEEYPKKLKTIKFLLPVRLSAQQATRYYARPYTARSRAGRKNILYADSPQAAGYRTREMN